MNAFNKKLLSLIALVAIALPALAQTAFNNANNRLVNTDFHSGVAVTVVDWNEDGLDDIVKLDAGHDLWIEIQNGSGQFESRHIGDFGSGSKWGMVAADVDKNGYKDILTGGSTCVIMMISDDGMTGTKDTLPNGVFFMQNATFADFNNDGWIDLFACNDVNPSRMWLNDGAGNLVSSSLINFDITPGQTNGTSNDDSGNYGSVWTDFDNDGDLDLYIAKCRQGVGSSSDPRRIDVLFVNDGNNNYTEMATTYNLADSAQTWTASFGDIDNDGDFDVFRTEENQPANLYKNDGTGHYTNGTAAAGINLTMTPIQSVMADFDNDGFIDIMASGGTHHILHNNGDGTFTMLANAFDNNDIESFAVGDLNHDGFVDIYASYANIYTNPTSIDDVVWLNQANDNHFFVLNLKGTVSNIDAIGARAYIYGAWGVQLREVRSGESYGTANTMMLHYGIGQNTSIDSVVIKWPSGISQTITNPSIDQFLTVIESDCVSPEALVTVDGDYVICPGQSTDLHAPAGYTYLWNNGATTQTLSASETGEYFVKITQTGSNCYSISAAVTLTNSPDETPTVAATGATTFCAGGSVELTAPAGYASYLWSNGATTQNTFASESGTYTLVVQGLCDAFTSNPIIVNALPSTTPTATGDTIYAPGGNATLEADGDSILWFNSSSGGSPIWTGNTFTTPYLTTSGTYYAANLAVYDGAQFNGGPANHAGTSNYSGSNTINAKMYFDVYENSTIVSVKVYTDRYGERNIQLYNSSNQLLDEQLVDVQTDTAVVTLNFEVAPGTGYYLTTDATYNQLIPNWNAASPRFRRTSGPITYPYNIDNLLSITGSDQGSTVYYYFYDWLVKEQPYECLSELVPVEVYYDLSIGLVERQNGIALYPNPTADAFFIKHDGSLNGKRMIIQDVTGRVVSEIDVNNAVQKVSTANLAAGVYSVRLNGSDSVIKLVVQR